ncbi:MAG TPA: lycopene cyclase family protein, partial [Saprospiraceae bacterium]|nr:lycopene cyclase family protein [Saprospiraceae bacterium]
MEEASEKFDLIIAGGGAAGLSLAYRLCNATFAHLNIALVDPEVKTGIDHTWCSWMVGNQIFDDCAVNFFSKIRVAGKGQEMLFNIEPYQYRMLQSSQFYSLVNSAIDNTPNIKRFTQKILSIDDRGGKLWVAMDSGVKIIGDKVVKSYLDNPVQIKANNALYLDQHFKGWFIRTKEKSFDTTQCTFMDFNIDQNGETRFMYVLPISPNEALVEVAIFSNDILEMKQYESILQSYIHNNLKLMDYEIYDEEFGIIPMTSGNLEPQTLTNVTLIGTAGGGIKSSTGFAFERI